MPRLALLLALLLALSGCTTTWGRYGAEATPDYQVKIETSEGTGVGVLTSPNTVVTVEHVVKLEDPESPRKITVHRGREKRCVKSQRKLKRKGGIEFLVELTLCDPLEIVDPPFLRPMRPGDSGSPILGRDGEVIGFVYGYSTNMFLVPGNVPLGVMAPGGK